MRLFPRQQGQYVRVILTKSQNQMKYDITTSDPDLIEGCLSGQEAAWEVLVTKYERLIFSTCRRYNMQQAEAEDILGRVCLMLIQHLASLKDRSRLVSWLITTTSRECWHYRKADAPAALPGRTGDDETGQSEEPPDENLLPEELLLQLERQQQVRQCLAQLPDRCRKLIWYLFYDPTEPSYADISSALGIPTSAIGPNRARCLEKLKTQVLKVMENSPD
jgi:RNA polymerase sigma factor (sigma-70 family)